MASSGVLVVRARSRTNVRSRRPRSSGLAIGAFFNGLTFLVKIIIEGLRSMGNREYGGPPPGEKRACTAFCIGLLIDAELARPYEEKTEGNDGDSQGVGGDGLEEFSGIPILIEQWGKGQEQDKAGPAEDKAQDEKDARNGIENADKETEVEVARREAQDGGRLSHPAEHRRSL